MAAQSTAVRPIEREGERGGYRDEGIVNFKTSKLDWQTVLIGIVECQISRSIPKEAKNKEEGEGWERGQVQGNYRLVA